jgi:putative flippase GtrA
MRLLHRFGRFSLVGALGVVIQLVVVQAMVSAGADAAVATALAVAVTLAHNFIWHWRWTWADRMSQGAASVSRSATKFVVSNGAVSLVGNTALVALLSGRLGVPVLAANLIAIGACSFVNFWMADAAIFVGEQPPRSSARCR